MALNQEQLNAISTSMQTAKQLLTQLKPTLDLLNVTMNAAGGLLATVQQADLDAVPAYSGITVQQLKDGVFPLTGAVLNDIAGSFNQLAQLAARA